MTTQAQTSPLPAPLPAALKPPKEANRGFWARLLRMPRARVGLVCIAIVVFGAIFAPVLAPAGPTEQFRDGLSPLGTPLPPSERFIFGTDHLGRDLFTRVLYGAQVSLTIALVANLIAGIFGTLVGIYAGYYGGLIDSVLMRITDVLLAFPAVLLALGMAAVFRPSMTVVIIIVSVITWPALARLVRSQTLTVRERTFVESARSVGANDRRIIFLHVFPQILPIAIVWGTLSIASTVLIEASLGFLGVGVPPPTPTWGNMIAEGQSRYRIAPWMILVPTVAIFITTLGFNLFGDAVRDALDPRSRQQH